MATIKEMQKRFVHNYTKGGTKQSWLEDGFIEGANAVLVEIEKMLSLWPEHPIKRTIRNKIEELKDE